MVYSNQCSIGDLCVVPSEPLESNLKNEASVTVLTGTGYTNHESQRGDNANTDRLVNRVAGVRVLVEESCGILVPDGTTAGGHG